MAPIHEFGNSAIGRFYRLILIALVTGSLLFHAAILWESRHKMAAGYGDFLIFYTGAQIVNDGRASELFKPDIQNTYQSKFEAPRLEWPLPFNHAPYELIIFLPLAHLSYATAHLIWSGINILLLFLMLRSILRYVNSPDNGLIAAGLAAWFPTLEVLRMGQDSILSAALLLGVFFALKQHRDGWAGFYLALGLYKPQLVLPMAGALLVVRRWWTMAVFSATGAVLVIVSVIMVGFHGVSDLLSMLSAMDQYSFIVDPSIMPNLRGLFYALLPAGDGKWVADAATASISVALYALCLRTWRNKCDTQTDVFDLQFGLVLVTTSLVSYHMYAHDLFLLSLSLILFYRYLDASAPRNTSVAFFALLLFLFLPIMPRWLIEAKRFSWTAILVLILYAIVMAEMFWRWVPARARV